MAHGLDNLIRAGNTSYVQKVIQKLESGKKGTIVFLGDSTTEVNSHTNGYPNHVDLLRIYLEGKYGVNNVNVINSGVSGNTIQKMWSRGYVDVCKHKPDLVVICSGLNDATAEKNISNELFEECYKGIIEEVLSTTDADIILRTSNKTVFHNDVNTRLKNELNPIIRSLANAYNIGYIDIYSYWEYLVENGITIDTIHNDSYHPNEIGHEYIYEYMLPMFDGTGNIYAKNRKNIRFVPAGHSDIVTTLGSGNLSDNFYNGIGYARYSYVSDKWVELTFYGTGVEIIYGISNNCGKVEIKIDGSVIEPAFDMYYPVTLWRKIYYVYGLEEGNHTVRVTHINDKNIDSSGYNIFLQGFVILGNEEYVEKIPRTVISDTSTEINVKGVDIIEFAQPSAIDITNFTNGIQGQEIFCIFSNSNTTILHTTNIKLSSSISWNPNVTTNKATLTLKNNLGKWYEKSRMVP